LPFLNRPLLLSVRPRCSGDFSAVLFEAHIRGVGLGFSIGIGDIKAAGPLAGKLRGAQRQCRKQQTAQNIPLSVPPYRLQRRKSASVCSRKFARNRARCPRTLLSDIVWACFTSYGGRSSGAQPTK